MSFSRLGLSESLLRALQDCGHFEATPIQTAAIPAILRGGDVWASAETGSGKTAAFALPILELLQGRPRRRGQQVRALVLVPTRELAAQVGQVFRGYAQPLTPRLKVEVAFGGVSINPQMMALRGGADVVVATPGRLLDLVGRNAVVLSDVEVLVLDEADRLLALGFAEELARVFALLPARRQSVLFSATFPPAVEKLAAEWLREPVRIDVPREAGAGAAIVQRAIEVDEARRTQVLRHLIETERWTRVLVFVATKYATEHIAEKLRRAGLAAAALHGELSQGARTQALAEFKAAKVRVLVATDVAARGLDIVELPVVVNYDLPRSPADYVHRIGRTGRAGESGVAVSFVSAETHAHFRVIEKRQRIAVPREQIAGFEPREIAVASLPPTGGGGVKGKRKSKKDKAREAAARAGGAPEAAGDIRKTDTEKAAMTNAPKAAAAAGEMFPWRPRVPRAGRGI